MNELDLGFGALSIHKLPLSDEVFESHKEVLPEEMSSAVESRQHEFVAGRVCAFEAAKNLGFELRELKRGDSREPLWPSGLIGSISHTQGIALALVDATDSSFAIGIDIEKVVEDSKFETIEKKVATDKELGFLKLFADKKRAYTVLFSAKEALFKLLFPHCGVFFGFEEARLVALDFDTQEFALLVTSEKEQLKKFKKKYVGKFYELDGCVLSVMRIDSNSL